MPKGYPKAQLTEQQAKSVLDDFTLLMAVRRRRGRGLPGVLVGQGRTGLCSGKLLERAHRCMAAGAEDQCAGGRGGAGHHPS